MVETVKEIGDALGVLWAFFQDESGQLTLSACLFLAGIALSTAYRCFQAMKPAVEEKLPSVIAAGSLVTFVFSFFGIFFLVQAASQFSS
jgi:hypothetical protein